MKKQSSRRKRLVARLSDLIWEDRPSRSWLGRWLIGRLRVLFFAVRGFKEHQCSFRASALTLVTLLSIVPVLALGFAAIKGLGLKQVLIETRQARATGSEVGKTAATTPTVQTLVPRGGNGATTTPAIESPTVKAAPPVSNRAQAKSFAELLRDALTRQLTADQEEIWNRIVSYVERTDFGALKAVGIIFLVFIAIAALGTMESVFNEIWGVRRGRSLVRKFADYLSVIVVCPVLVAAAMAMTAAISSNALIRRLEHIGFFNEAISWIFAVAPFVSVCLALTFLYLFLPNTRVRLRHALAGGFVAGVIWQLAFWGYTHFQGNISRYNAIYSTLAALPFFLTWLYTSWLIVLFGAEIAAAPQNFEAYTRERATRHVSTSERLRIGLNLVLAICARFRREQQPWNASQLSRYLDCPAPLVEEILRDLCNGGILEVSGDGKSATYRPATALANISPARVIEALQESDSSGIMGNATPEAVCARTLMGQWREGMWRELGQVGFDVLVDKLGTDAPRLRSRDQRRESEK